MAPPRKFVIATKSSGTILNTRSVARRVEGKAAWSKGARQPPDLITAARDCFVPRNDEFIL